MIGYVFFHHVYVSDLSWLISVFYFLVWMTKKRIILSTTSLRLPSQLTVCLSVCQMAAAILMGAGWEVGSNQYVCLLSKKKHPSTKGNSLTHPYANTFL